ncbi:acyltransferase domain-containing protein [Acanthopleuribacter pedis]|uniref:Acyltransferase domain-containing protein n=1 Tax=Acanthopleuribacter pedis TaxID=442870 RepID=A0A8J7U5D7_9BACT|nr:acyltransferase domain-containing protein [Acanthopleuribacter pedis]MBO1322443.1 acyltransferase domain-containing protein [Acanthopleuribacter pedis]
MKPIVFMYSGQGAQYFHMGKELFDKEPAFKQALLACDDIVRGEIGTSLVDVMYDPGKKKSEPFDRLEHTHPGCFMIGHAMGRLLRSKGIQPQYVMGYSLGEWNAAVDAGVMELGAVLRSLIQQAKLFMEVAPEAGMTAILADPAIMQERPDLFQDSWLGGVNFPNHFCITARPERLDLIEQRLTAEDVICQRLPVHRGFHSPLVEMGKERYLANCPPTKFPSLPFYSGVAGGSVDLPDPVHFWRACREPVMFNQTAAAMERQGAMRYVDLGPSGTLANFVKYGLSPQSQSETFTILTPFGRETNMLQKALTGLRG